jgi:glycine/D-amino acid oxidase-like deaminating enzyme
VSDVTVIDRASVASASSGLSVGIIETQYLDPLAIEIRVLAMGIFAELERDAGLHITRNGYLRLARSESDLEGFHRSVEVQKELGVVDAQVLDAAALQKLVPDMRCDDLPGGLFGPRDGYIDGHLYCNLLAEAVLGRGARVHASTQLVGYTALADGRHRLQTSKGTFECTHVVNAAGGWAGRVGELLGAPVPILPQRHQALVAHLPRALEYVMPSVMDYIPASGDFGLYFRHESPEHLIAGLHTEEAIHDLVDPDNFGRADEQDYMERVAERFGHRLPGLADARLGNVWAGLYPISPDGLPIVGPFEVRDGVFAVAGAGGSGLQQSPALGRLAAEWIVYGEPRSLGGAEVLRPERSSLAV